MVCSLTVYLSWLSYDQNYKELLHNHCFNPLYEAKRFKKRIIKIEHISHTTNRTDLDINIEKQYPL